MEIKTFTYIKKSGEYYIELPDKFLHIDSHVKQLLEKGWEPLNSAADPGHVRVGKTLVVATLTGGLSLLFGASRTANTITITFKKVNRPEGYCSSCGSSLLREALFCSHCGATSKAATAVLPNPHPAQRQSRAEAVTAGRAPHSKDAYSKVSNEASQTTQSSRLADWMTIATIALGVIMMAVVIGYLGRHPSSSSTDSPAAPASQKSEVPRQPEIDLKQIALRRRATVESVIGRPRTTEPVKYSSPPITMAKYPWGELYYQRGRLTGLEYRFQRQPSRIEDALAAVGLEMTSPPEDHSAYFSWSDGPSSFRPDAGYHPLVCCGFGYELPWVSVSKGLDTIWVDFAYLDQRKKWPAALRSAWQKLDR